MSKIIDLKQGNLGDMKRQQHRDRYATPLNGSSVGSGGMRFYGEGRLTVENEGLYVVGTANISGLLNVTGTSTFTGDTSMNGPTDVAGTFTVTGPTTLDGVTDIGGATTITGTLDVTGAMATKGTLSVEGVTTVKSDLNVTAGGKINVGGMSLDPTDQGGSVAFAGGPRIGASAGSLGIIDGTGEGGAQLYIGGGVASLHGGGSVLGVESAGVTVSGNLIAANLPTTTQKANLYVDSNGRIHRSTAV